MKITLLGAAGGEVTGSAYLVETGSATLLVDCGMFQGAQKLENGNRLPTRGALQRLDAVVLTHVHLDHTGRLPLLTRFGYRGPIFATSATISLADWNRTTAASVGDGVRPAPRRLDARAGRGRAAAAAARDSRARGAGQGVRQGVARGAPPASGDPPRAAARACTGGRASANTSNARCGS
jgi:glyoxylase-like metal-dependent hydrolase (beta-lactamase superfamily II)